MSLPIKPPIGDADFERRMTPTYMGGIEPGMVFVWEPDLPFARELLVVTEITPPLPPLHVKHARGQAFIGQGSETQIWSVPFPDGGREVSNDASRFREAVHLSRYRNQHVPSLKRVRS